MSSNSIVSSGVQPATGQVLIQSHQQQHQQASLATNQAGGGGTGSDIMITIPSAVGSENVEFPYTISIPTSSGMEKSQEKKGSTDSGPSVQTTGGIGTMAGQQQQQQQDAPSFMITIDPASDTSSGQASYTVSLPRFGSGANDDSKVVNIATVAPTASVQAISTTTTPSMATSNAGSMQQNNTICVNSLMNNVLNNTQVTPTLQSQINEIQNQLIAEAQPHLVAPTSKSSNIVSSAIVPTSHHQQMLTTMAPLSGTAAAASSVGTSTTTSIVIATNSSSKLLSVPSPSPKKKSVTMASSNQGNVTMSKKNGKKLEKSFDTIGTTSAVPTQIGNIQISQVDGTTANQHKAVKGGTINNQIQITPIIDNKVVNAAGTQYQSLAALQSSASQPQSAVTIQSQVQPQQQQQQGHSIIPSVGGGTVSQNQQQPQPSHTVQSVPTSIQSNVIAGSGGVVFTTQQQQPTVVATPTVQLNQTSITPTALVQPPVATAQGILAQLTGSLSLSLAENGQLILKHDVNQPQTPESQTILQAILSGALVLNHQQPIPTQPQQQHTVLVNPNAPKLVELPKVGPNQQLFSLNTLTNQITQLSPGQTTAALGPMERVLIVPTGINAQQLAQCLMQGQIHFNNVGQVTQSSETRPTPTLTQSQQPALSSTPSTTTIPKTISSSQTAAVEQQQTKNQSLKGQQIVINPGGNSVNSKALNNSANVTNSNNVTATNTGPIVKEKPKRNRSKKQDKAQPAASPSKPAIIKVNTMASGFPPSVVLQPVTATTSSNNNITVTATAVKKGRTNVAQQQLQNQVPQQQMPPLVSVNSMVPASTSLSSSSPIAVGTPTVVPRVQTIQLTPQKQQHLKSVQQQIQQLSTKLQNKNLLSSLLIPAEFDPSNPIHNKPLPSIKNLQTMSDKEICSILQRLFMEQQKILSTGKIIPTIQPTGHTFASSNTQQTLPPPPTPISNIQTHNEASVNSVTNASTDQKSQQAIITPITVTPSSGTTIFQGGVTGSGASVASSQIIGKHELLVPLSSTANPNMSVLTSGGTTSVAPSAAHSSMSITITSSTLPMQSAGSVQKFGGANVALAKQTTTIIPITSTLQHPPSAGSSAAGQQVIKSLNSTTATTVPSVVNNASVAKNISVPAGTIVPKHIMLSTTGGQSQTNPSVMPPLHTLVPTTQQQVNTSGPLINKLDIGGSGSGALGTIVNHQQSIATNQMPSAAGTSTSTSSPAMATIAPVRTSVPSTASAVTSTLPPPLVPSSVSSSSTIPFSPGGNNGGVSSPVISSAIVTAANTTIATVAAFTTTTTTASALSSAVVAASAMNNNSSTPAVIIAAPAGTSPSTPMTYITTNVPNSPAVKVPRASLFEIQIQKDQDACTKPDTNTPFGSKQDAIKRLIRYHCMYEEKCEENEEEELQFETTAEWFPEAFRTMLSRYQRLMINESMREVRTSELMLVNKLFKADITQEIEEMQEHLRETESLTVPPKDGAEDVICVSSSDEDKPKFKELSSAPQGRQSPMLPLTLPDATGNSMSGGSSQADLCSGGGTITSDSIIPISVNGPAGTNAGLADTVRSSAFPGSETSLQSTFQKSNMTMSGMPNCSVQHTTAKHETVSSNRNNTSVRTPWCDAFKKHARTATNSYDDIESEITPSFIMKKADGGVNEEKKRDNSNIPPLHGSLSSGMVTSSAPPTLRYFNQVHLPTEQKNCVAESPSVDNNSQIPLSCEAGSPIVTSQLTTAKQQTVDQNESAYDEWMCFQKDLSYFTGSSDGNGTNEADGGGVRIGGTNAITSLTGSDVTGRRKTTEEEIHEMFNSNDSKSVDKQLEQLFSSTAEDKPSSAVSRVDSPLTEFFNNHQRSSVVAGGAEACGGSSSTKSVETRLDALFGGCETLSRHGSGSSTTETRASVMGEKTDDLLTGRHWSSAVFQPSQEEEESTSDSFLQKTSASSYEVLQQQQQHQHSSSGGTQKRHWTGTVAGGGNSGSIGSSVGMLYANDASENESISPNKRQCMSLDNSAKPLDDSNQSDVKSDDHRWLMECTGNSDNPTTATSQMQRLGAVGSNGSIQKAAQGNDHILVNNGSNNSIGRTDINIGCGAIVSGGGGDCRAISSGGVIIGNCRNGSTGNPLVGQVDTEDDGLSAATNIIMMGRATNNNNHNNNNNNINHHPHHHHHQHHGVSKRTSWNGDILLASATAEDVDHHHGSVLDMLETNLSLSLNNLNSICSSGILDNGDPSDTDPLPHHHSHHGQQQEEQLH
uniref:GLTSCR1 domain-containing protein n=1 Tax=Anopheles maculatus TaxID=74869 RepID=A0A182S6Z7_9DIPT